MKRKWQTCAILLETTSRYVNERDPHESPCTPKLIMKGPLVETQPLAVRRAKKNGELEALLAWLVRKAQGWGRQDKYIYAGQMFITMSGLVWKI